MTSTLIYQTLTNVFSEYMSDYTPENPQPTSESNGRGLEDHEKWIIALAIIGWVAFVAYMVGTMIF